MLEEIVIDSADEKKYQAELDARKDAEAARMRRFMAMPDLSRTSDSPLYELAQKITALPVFDGFSVVKVPEIVPASQSFDLFDFPANHPARSKSDTYYVTTGETHAPDAQILRTHCTVSWYYYFTSEYAKEKMAKGESLGVLTYGKVYRKDEIDSRHMNVFHQMDGYFIQPRSKGEITQKDLENVLSQVIETVFGKNTKYRFNKDTFPYTDPSLEVEVMIGEKWVEILGSGVIKGSVLEKLGVDSKQYTGWAFGFGLERLAIIGMELPDIRLLWSADPRVKKQLKLGTKFKEVSKYPPITRDISFIVPKTFVPNNYFDLIRDIVGDLAEEVTLIDKYENDKKFGTDKMSYAYRIVYRSTDRTLTVDEIEPLQNKVIEETKKQFGAEVR